MTEPDSCGECEIIAEKYEKCLEGEKKNLISFRGHGFLAKKSLQKIEPFSTSEIKTMLKLILLGCKKLHFVKMKNRLMLLLIKFEWCPLYRMLKKG